MARHQTHGRERGRKARCEECLPQSSRHAEVNGDARALRFVYGYPPGLDESRGGTLTVDIKGAPIPEDRRHVATRERHESQPIVRRVRDKEAVLAPNHGARGASCK